MRETEGLPATPEQIEAQDRRDEPDVAPVIDICDVEGGDGDGDSI